MANKKRARKQKNAQNLREKIAQNQLAAASANNTNNSESNANNASAAANSNERASEKTKMHKKPPQIHGLADDDTEYTDTCSPSSRSRYSDSSSRYRSYSSSSSGYDADEDDSDDSHEWCIHCKSLIQMPVYEKNAHFHSGRFDMWLCRKCFPTDHSDNKTCKCVMHCTACARDVLYNDRCIPFYNTSRGFCDTCSDNIKRVAGGESSVPPPATPSRSQ